MKSSRRRIDVNLEELDRVLDGARQTPLSEGDCDKVKNALHALAAMLPKTRNTEKNRAVLPQLESADADNASPPDTDAVLQAGHGRNGADAFGGARKIDISHQ